MVPNPRLVVTLLRLGAPMGVQMIMVSLAEIAVITFVNRFGSDATAAYAAVNQIGSYVQFPALSIGIAASIFGAQSIGAGRTELLGAVVRSSVALNYIIEGALILIVYGFANVILGMFLTSETHASHRTQSAQHHALELCDLWKRYRHLRHRPLERDGARSNAHLDLLDLGS